MISFDYDKLLNAVIYFCCFPRYIFSTVDLCVYTSDKHFVRSRFILIAPLCQRLLMIFCCTFTQRSAAVSFVFRRHARRNDFRCWSKRPFISKETRDYTISFEAEPEFLRDEQRTLRGFVLHTPKNVFIVYPRSRPEQTSWCERSDAKHRIFVQPSPLSSLKTIPRLHNIWKKHEGGCGARWGMRGNYSDRVVNLRDANLNRLQSDGWTSLMEWHLSCLRSAWLQTIPKCLLMSQ